jgi:hypothetical protein
MGEQVLLAVRRWPDVWRDGMGGGWGGREGCGGQTGRGGEGRARRGRWEGPDGGENGGGQTGKWGGQTGGDVPDGAGGGEGVARRDGGECRTGICGGQTGWEGVRTGRTQGTAREGVRTKGKDETGSLDHVCMQYVGSFGASSRSSSVESSVLSSSSCSGNPLRRCKTSFLMTMLLVH